MAIEIEGIKFSKHLHYTQNDAGAWKMGIKDKGSAYTSVVGNIDCVSEPLITNDPLKVEWIYTIKVCFVAVNTEWSLIQTLTTPTMQNSDIKELMAFVKNLYKREVMPLMK